MASTTVVYDKRTGDVTFFYGEEPRIVLRANGDIEFYGIVKIGDGKVVPLHG